CSRAADRRSLHNREADGAAEPHIPYSDAATTGRGEATTARARSGRAGANERVRGVAAAFERGPVNGHCRPVHEQEVSAAGAVAGVRRVGGGDRAGTRGTRWRWWRGKTERRPVGSTSRGAAARTPGRAAHRHRRVRQGRLLRAARQRRRVRDATTRGRAEGDGSAGFEAHDRQIGADDGAEAEAAVAQPLLDHDDRAPALQRAVRADALRGQEPEHPFGLGPRALARGPARQGSEAGIRRRRPVRRRPLHRAADHGRHPRERHRDQAVPEGGGRHRRRGRVRAGARGVPRVARARVGADEGDAAEGRLAPGDRRRARDRRPLRPRAAERAGQDVVQDDREGAGCVSSISTGAAVSMADSVAAAEAAAATKDWSRAADLLAGAGDATDVLDKRVFYLSRAKRYEEAVELLARLRERDPDSFLWPYMTAYQYYAQELYAESLPWFRETLKRNPKHIKSWWRSANALSKSGQEMKAMACAGRVLRLWHELPQEAQERERSNLAKASYLCGKVQMRNDPAGAVPLLEQAVANDKSDPHKHYRLGKALRR